MPLVIEIADGTYRLWTNPERTILMRLWDTGIVEVATRESEDSAWGPPSFLYRENV